MSEGQTCLDLCLEYLSFHHSFDVDEDLGDAEKPHNKGDDTYTVGQLVDPEGKAGKPQDHVKTDASKEYTHESHHERSDHWTLRQIGEDYQACAHEREVLRRAEFQSHIGKRFRDQHQTY